MRTMRLAREICVAWHEWAAYQAEKRERLRCALAHFNEHACQVTFNLWRYRVFVDAKIQRHMLRLWFHRLHAACRAGQMKAAQSSCWRHAAAHSSSVSKVPRSPLNSPASRPNHPA